MSLSIGGNQNNYNLLFANNKKVNSQKKPANAQFYFMTMGTVRNAVIQQRTKDNMQSKFDETSEPAYDKKVTWYGIDITENPDIYKEIVPISDKAKKEIYENVKKDFETTGKRSKDDISLMENFYKMCDKYVSNLEGLDKLKTSWSLSQYRSSVHSEVESKIRELDKKWD